MSFVGCPAKPLYPRVPLKGKTKRERLLPNLISKLRVKIRSMENQIESARAKYGTDWECRILSKLPGDPLTDEERYLFHLSFIRRDLRDSIERLKAYESELSRITAERKLRNRRRLKIERFIKSCCDAAP